MEEKKVFEKSGSKFLECIDEMALKVEMSDSDFVFNSTMLEEEVLLHIKHCEFNLCDPIINTCLNTSKKNYSNTYFYAYSSLYSSA